MPLPVGIATVTITGTVLAPDGTPAVGSIDFVPSVPVLYVGVDVVTLPVRVSAVLVAGVFPAAFKLPATDDTAGNPTGWTWHVTERITGGRSFDVNLAQSPTTIDYSSLSPVPTSSGVPVVVGPAGPATTDASLLTSGTVNAARLPALPYDPLGASAAAVAALVNAAPGTLDTLAELATALQAGDSVAAALAATVAGKASLTEDPPGSGLFLIGA